MAKLTYRTKVRPFTEQEHKEWKHFRATRCISAIETKFVCELYAAVFNKPIEYQEAQKPIIKMIDKLDLVYGSYLN